MLAILAILKKSLIFSNLAEISCVPEYVISSGKCSIKILKIAKAHHTLADFFQESANF